MPAEALFAVTTTAKLLAHPTTVRSYRRSLTINNISAGDVYVGGPGVTTSLYTFKVPAGQVASISGAYVGDPLPADNWYVVGGAAGNVVLTESVGS